MPTYSNGCTKPREDLIMNKTMKYLLPLIAKLYIVEPSVASAADKLETAPTKFVEANGIKFSYRAIGQSTGIPLILLQHFTGTMDSWDPAVVNCLGKERPVIVFNNTGVGSSSGKVPDNVEQMSIDAQAFINALGYKKVDLLGFSLGGYVAQDMAAKRPDLVRKVILAGTSHQGGGEHLLKVLGEAFSQKDSPDPRLYLFFTQSKESQEAGRMFITRASTRKEQRDPESGKEVSDPQAKAIIVWANTNDPDNKILKSINQPVLVVNGSNDIMLISDNSYTLFKLLNNAQLVLYPDSGHGSIFQYHEQFVTSANYFLNH
jgi:pimeloyl-ACP methyl ester carboxylesterase